MDFIASLPLEVAVNILFYLDSEDAVRCLAVNHLWREIVGAQDTYWKKACIRFGLPGYLIEDHKNCCTSPVAFFLAARKQRLYVSGTEGMFSPLERQEGEYPCHVATKKRSNTDGLWAAPSRAQSVGGEHFLEIVYEEEHLIPNERYFYVPRANISLGILGRINGRNIEKVCEVAPDVCKSEWLRYLPHHQCVVAVVSNTSADGSMLWLKWSIPLQLKSHPSQLLSIPGSSRSPPVKLYSACLQCSLMVQLDDHSTLDFIALDRTGRLTHLRTDKVDLPHPHHYNVTIVLCPSGCSASIDYVCTSHHLVLGVGHSIRFHRFETVSAHCFRFNFTSAVQLSSCEFGRTGQPRVSSDGKLLGILQSRYHGPSTLHVWHLVTSDCTKISEVEIHVHLQSPFSRPALYALGHTYSIIGYHTRCTVNVTVVATHTGETVWKYSKSVISVADHSPMRTMRPGFSFLAVIRDDWLSNVHTVSPPSVPFMVFKNNYEAVEGNLVINGLSFQP